MSDLSPDQIDLLLQLREALAGHDPVPASVLMAAHEAYTWRTIDEELAELAYDSTEQDLVGVRATAVARQLSFETDAVTLDVEIEEDGAQRVLRGQIAPAAPGLITARSLAGDVIVERAAPADELGRFVITAVPAGRMSLRCEVGGDVVLATSWLSI
jgi:hypothetical protein